MAQSQPKPFLEEKVNELESLLEKAVKCTKELSACLRQQSSPMKVSSPMREQYSSMEEQSLVTEKLSSKTQLEVSAHMCW